MIGRGEHSLALQGQQLFARKKVSLNATQCLLAHLNNVCIGTDTNDGVHLRNLLHHLVLVTLSQAASDHNGSGLILGHLQDGLNGLSLSVLNKTTGVNDHQVAVFNALHDLKSVFT